MDSQKQIRVFSLLGDEIQQMIEKEDEVINTMYKKNSWFVPEFVKSALGGLSHMLKEEKLYRWLSKYPHPNKNKKNIGIIMAGNIPAVGFHDLITVLCSLKRAVIKLSHNDNVLIPYLVDLMIKIDPAIKHQIKFMNSLDRIDAIIATGSDNTSRYFEYTFRGLPRLIRKNRTSCCILNGYETSGELAKLSNDIFSYFGMGCRNVSKLFIPPGYNIESLLPHFSTFSWIKNHSKYYHNYSFQSSRYILEHRQFIDGQFFIMAKSKDLVSPLSCLYYDEYGNTLEAGDIIRLNKNKIQCVVSSNGLFPNNIDFGMAQYPELWDYADDIDTMKFLAEI
jgi:5'(3')-deoxyribonucleotidase